MCRGPLAPTRETMRWGEKVWCSLTVDQEAAPPVFRRVRPRAAVVTRITVDRHAALFDTPIKTIP
jgi:hypothetical protein